MSTSQEWIRSWCNIVNNQRAVVDVVGKEEIVVLRLSISMRRIFSQDSGSKI